MYVSPQAAVRPIVQSRDVCVCVNVCRKCVPAREVFSFSTSCFTPSFHTIFTTRARYRTQHTMYRDDMLSHRGVVVHDLRGVAVLGVVCSSVAECVGFPECISPRLVRAL